jgi:hypothetical protein
MYVDLLSLGVVALVGLAALVTLRRERRQSASVHPFVVGAARGLSVVILGWIVLGVVRMMLARA